MCPLSRARMRCGFEGGDIALKTHPLSVVERDLPPAKTTASALLEGGNFSANR